MNELSEFWQEEKEEYKKRCEKRNDNYEPRLIELGAIKKSEAVYEYDGYFCYPTKGFAMEKKNSQNRIGLDTFIKERTNITERMLNKCIDLMIDRVGYLCPDENLTREEKREYYLNCIRNDI